MPLTLEQRIAILEDKVKHNTIDINGKQNKLKSGWVDVNGNISSGFRTVTTDGVRVFAAAYAMYHPYADAYKLNKGTGMWLSLNWLSFVTSEVAPDFGRKIRYYDNKIYLLSDRFGVMGYTSDGVNWTNINNPYQNTSNNAHFNWTTDFDIVDMGGPIPRIYLVGKAGKIPYSCYFDPFIIYTDDYGSNWVNITPDLVLLGLSINSLRMPYCIHHYTQEIYIGTVYHVLKYTPGTDTWSMIVDDILQLLPPFTLGCIKTPTAFVWGHNHQGLINDITLRTVDDGATITMSAQSIAPYMYFNHTPNDAYKGIYAYNYGIIYKSIDEGIAWWPIGQPVTSYQYPPQIGDLCVARDTSNMNSARRVYVTPVGGYPIVSLQL